MKWNKLKKLIDKKLEDNGYSDEIDISYIDLAWINNIDRIKLSVSFVKESIGLYSNSVMK